MAKATETEKEVLRAVAKYDAGRGVTINSLARKLLAGEQDNPLAEKAIRAAYAKVVSAVEKLTVSQQKAVLTAAGSKFTLDALFQSAKAVDPNKKPAKSYTKKIEEKAKQLQLWWPELGYDEAIAKAKVLLPQVTRRKKGQMATASEDEDGE